MGSAHPDLSLLRKDFILYEEEVDVSYRAGADAVLLIARILETPLLLVITSYSIHYTKLYDERLEALAVELAGRLSTLPDDRARGDGVLAFIFV